MKTLALIPARGGSKGIPRKNIKLIAGKPLIAWTIEAALNSKYIDEVILSTEDDEIMEVGKSWGAKVPFKRPADISLDETPGIDPVYHAMEVMKDYEAVLLLQATSPLRDSKWIDSFFESMKNHSCNSKVSVTKIDKHPHWMYSIDENAKMKKFINAPFETRRQDLASLYALNGAIYYSTREHLDKFKCLVSDETHAFEMDKISSIDIDDPIDWQIAEFLLNQRI